MTKMLLPLILFFAVTTTTKAADNVEDTSNKIPNDFNPATQHKSLQDLLSHCCRTMDGIERDCCRLVYPNISDSTSFCSCPSISSPPNKMSSPRSHFYPHHHSQFVPFHTFNPFFNTRAGIDQGHASSECHPMTTNIAAPTQRLLHRCCYVPPSVGLSVGLDCLALAFPLIPKAQRCGECTTPGTMQDLYYECCNADDGIERDCCALLAPFNRPSLHSHSYGKNGRPKSYCPCPKKKNANRSPAQTVQEPQNDPRYDPGTQNEGAKRCHPSTTNVAEPTRRLLDKCCLANQMLGLHPAIDCLALAFPTIPWNERCGQCDSDMRPKDLLNECCGTRDGIPRNCCQLVFPKIPENQRFCPCRATGSTAQTVDIIPAGLGKRRQGQLSPFHALPLDIYNFAGSRYTAFQGSYNFQEFGDQCPIQSPEPAVNLHTFCCNTHGKKELGFTCERVVLGKEPDHGNRPCGAWANTLDPQPPSGEGNTDYTDYEDYQ